MEGASELAEAKRGTKGKAGPGLLYWITIGPELQQKDCNTGPTREGGSVLGNLQITTGGLLQLTLFSKPRAGATC